MARGGRRAGTPGKAYPNRTDLNGAPAPLPVVRPPSTVYGSQAAAVRSQQQVPMAAGPLPAAPSAAATPAPSSPTPPPTPGSLGAFDRPTERPAEPVTAGMPTGPGAGPAALGLPQMQAQNLGQFLAQAAASPLTGSYVQELANYVNSGRQ